MAEPFNFELILTDFLKYMPEAKRHDYELMLRRCNFSDPADPMFPVMLFLLFFQDNLADRMEDLTEEVKAQKTIPPTDHVTVSPGRKSCWKIVIAVLLAVKAFAFSPVSDALAVRQLLFPLLAAALLVPYFKRSTRVKNTFVNP